MTRRIVSLLFPIALALVATPFAHAQRGGHGGTPAAHAGGGYFGAGARGAFSPSFSPSLSRSPQSFGPPSMSRSFAPVYRGFNPSGMPDYGRPPAAYGQSSARFRSNYPATYSSYGREPRQDRRSAGYRRPYVYAYGSYLVPNLVGYPLGYDSFFDDNDGYDYEQADENASQSLAQPPPQQEIYGPPEDYAPEPAPYPGQNEEPSTGYRSPYQDSGELGALPAQPPTTLIFQDGRPTEQVHNYVLTKTTLYDLDASGRRDIPLADLNLPATIEANRSAGIDFSLPASY